MADVSHELDALRFVVDSPLSSKVAMFNNQVEQHKQGQLLNPFSQQDGRVSPKPQFSKDEYGKPIVGSLTERRGQNANIHVLKEMLELCQIINSEGYNVKDEPTMRVIPFGELFNIYNYISDKVVGILLRARKHQLVQFEGEMLFQRRDDHVHIFLLKPIKEITQIIDEKMETIKGAASATLQATSVLMDKVAHQKMLKATDRRSSKSRSASPRVAPTGAEASASVALVAAPPAAAPAPAPAETSIPPPALVTPPMPREDNASPSIAPKPTIIIIPDNEMSEPEPEPQPEPDSTLVGSSMITSEIIAVEHAPVICTGDFPPSTDPPHAAGDVSKSNIDNNNSNSSPKCDDPRNSYETDVKNVAITDHVAQQDNGLKESNVTTDTTIIVIVDDNIAGDSQ